MTPLRQQMITAMQVRGFSPRTHQAYLQAVQGLAKYYRQPPDRLDQDQISRYLEYLACERQLSASSCRQAFHIRLLVQVLKRDELKWLSGTEATPAHTGVADPSGGRPDTGGLHQPQAPHDAEVCYGCGLRVSELCQLRVSIDGQRHLLRVTQGKGAKDRAVTSRIRCCSICVYWQLCRPEGWLFSSNQCPTEPSIRPVSRRYIASPSFAPGYIDRAAFTA